MFLVSRGYFNPKEAVKQDEAEDTKVEQVTTLSVEPKASKDAPDLALSQTYTANINGEKITVPVKPSPGSLHSPGGTTATVTQEIDLTPLVKKLQPNWEIGIGVGYHNDLYIPVSLQRNYKPKRAVAAELHLSPSQKKINGYEVMHKWFF